MWASHNLKKHSYPTGFTVIEIILVLAVAGLIFLILFLAVPAAQRAAADNTHKQAAQSVLGELETYKTQAGRYPVSSGEQAVFATSYKIDFKVPGTGALYDVEYSQALFDTHNAAPTYGQILYVTAHWCAPAGSPDLVNGDDIDQTVVTVIVKLENGSIYCIDNH